MPPLQQPQFNPSFKQDLIKNNMPLVGEPVLTPGILEKLNVPDSVLLNSATVNSFMAFQCFKLNDITNRPEIRSLSGQISEPAVDVPTLSISSAMSEEEKEDWRFWTQEKMMHIQSGEGKPEDLSKEIEAYLKEAKKKYVEKQPSDVDVLGMATDMAIAQAIIWSEQEEQEWRRRLTLAAQSGSAEMFNTVLNEKAYKQQMYLVGRLVAKRAATMNEREAVMKDLGLSGDKAPSSAELAKTNMEFTKYQSDIQSDMINIQVAMGEANRILGDTTKTNTEIKNLSERLIRNLAVGG